MPTKKLIIVKVKIKNKSNKYYLVYYGKTTNHDC